ncbi:hypothetical protein ACFFK0_04060 [Paenibacillus chartarius]|uniref:DUF4367 domain-containing protein n=1 Tax=Paenibacillus chartarius TaxID=747481 RepID=A0ABV6DG55_9BACL
MAALQRYIRHTRTFGTLIAVLCGLLLAASAALPVFPKQHDTLGSQQLEQSLRGQGLALTPIGDTAYAAGAAASSLHGIDIGPLAGVWPQRYRIGTAEASAGNAPPRTETDSIPAPGPATEAESRPVSGPSPEAGSAAQKPESAAKEKPMPAEGSAARESGAEPAPADVPADETIAVYVFKSAAERVIAEDELQLAYRSPGPPLNPVIFRRGNVLLLYWPSLIINQSGTTYGDALQRALNSLS